MAKAPAKAKKQEPAFFDIVPGLTPRDKFFIELGHTFVQAINPKFDDGRFVLAAPDEETRLLGEVALEIMVEKLAPSSAAARLKEHVRIIVGRKSRTTSAVVQSMPRATNPRKLH